MGQPRQQRAVMMMTMTMMMEHALLLLMLLYGGCRSKSDAQEVADEASVEQEEGADWLHMLLLD